MDENDEWRIELMALLGVVVLIALIITPKEYLENPNITRVDFPITEGKNRTFGSMLKEIYYHNNI